MTRAGAAVLLVVFGLAVALPFLGSRGLYDPTEGRYAECAREMMVSGNYLEPTLAGRPHWTKPPLAYWSIAAGLRAVGRSAWGARAFNAAAFTLTGLVVAAAGTILFGGTAGLAAGLVYLSSPLPVLAAVTVSSDTLLGLWLALAVLFYVAARFRRTDRSRWWIRAMWLAFGLAFSTKGPPALLPLLAIVVYHVRARRDRSAAGVRLGDPAGIALFLAASLWWYAFESVRHPELVHYFIGTEVVGRNIEGQFQRNPQWYGPLAIYVPTLLVGLGAWVAPAVGLVRGCELYRWRGLGAAWRGRSAGLFVLLWFLVPLVVFSLARSRLPLYLLPLSAPLALAVARWVVGGRDGRHARGRDARRRGAGGGMRRIVALALASAAVLIALEGVAARWPAANDMVWLSGLAARVGGPNAHYLLYQESDHHGFAFYRDGDVERVGPEGASWTDRTMGQALAAIARRGGTWVFASSDARAGGLIDRLRSHDLPYATTSDRGWTLVVVTAGGHGDR